MILTSQRSAESVNKAVADLSDAWKEKRHYCVGVKTAETAATLLGLKNLAGQDCGNAENLSSLIVQGLTEKYFLFIKLYNIISNIEFQNGYLPLPLLFPCSSLKMDTLPRTLAQHDVSIEIVNSYVTVPHPHLQDFVLQLSHKVKSKII